MSIHSEEFRELVERARKMSTPDRLALVSHILFDVRRDHFPPPAEELEAQAKAAAEWAEAWIAQGGEIYDYPIPEETRRLIPDPPVRWEAASCNAATSTS